MPREPPKSLAAVSRSNRAALLYHPGSQHNTLKKSKPCAIRRGDCFDSEVISSGNQPNGTLGERTLPPPSHKCPVPQAAGAQFRPKTTYLLAKKSQYLRRLCPIGVSHGGQAMTLWFANLNCLRRMDNFIPTGFRFESRPYRSRYHGKV